MIADYGSNNGYNNWDNKIQYDLFGNVYYTSLLLMKKGVLKNIKGIGSKWYEGQSIASFVFNNKWDVIQINGDRVVIGVNDQVTGAISKKYREKI